MEGSIYILQFKNGGEMEDMILYTDEIKAFAALRLSWNTKSLIEYKTINSVADRIKYIYSCSENGEITRHTY